MIVCDGPLSFLPLSLPPSRELSSLSALEPVSHRVVWMPEHFSLSLSPPPSVSQSNQPESPMSLSTGGGTLGSTVELDPAVR